MRITFTDVVGVDEQYAPSPATRALPDWYKHTPEYVGGKREFRDGMNPHTVKKCIPVFDALTAGYVLRTYVDVQVTERDGEPWYEWGAISGVVQFHAIEQAPHHPSANGAAYPKWLNPWAIKTPRGYSCLFVPPMHNPNGMFTVMPGVVDTDSYRAPVNFPFTLDDPKWTGVIPAGTPMVQVIPFRRDTFRMEIGGDADRNAATKTNTRVGSILFNSYKRQFWSRKEYR